MLVVLYFLIIAGIGGIVKEKVTIHTNASLYQLIGYWGVNYHRFCTQNAKVQAFWRGCDK